MDEFLAELHLSRAQTAAAGVTAAAIAGLFLFAYVAPRLGRGLLAAGTWVAGRFRHEPSPLTKLLLERLAHPDWKLETTKSATCVLKGCEGTTYASYKDGLTRVWLSGCDDPAETTLIPSYADRVALHRAVVALYERLKMEQVLAAITASLPLLPAPQQPVPVVADVPVGGTPDAKPAAAPFDAVWVLSRLHRCSCDADASNLVSGSNPDKWVVWALNPCTYKMTVAGICFSLESARLAADQMRADGAIYLLAQACHLPQTEAFNRRNVRLVVR